MRDGRSWPHLRDSCMHSRLQVLSLAFGEGGGATRSTSLPVMMGRTVVVRTAAPPPLSCHSLAMTRTLSLPCQRSISAYPAMSIYPASIPGSLSRIPGKCPAGVPLLCASAHGCRLAARMMTARGSRSRNSARCQPLAPPTGTSSAFQLSRRTRHAKKKVTSTAVKEYISGFPSEAG